MTYVQPTHHILYLIAPASLWYLLPHLKNCFPKTLSSPTLPQDILSTSAPLMTLHSLLSAQIEISLNSAYLLGGHVLSRVFDKLWCDFLGSVPTPGPISCAWDKSCDMAA